MIRTIAAACLLASLAGPALAEPPLPPSRPADCAGLASARAEAHAASSAHGYEVRDLDGEAAQAFAIRQGIPAGIVVEHATIITDLNAHRGVLLLHDGPACAFGSIATELDAAAPPLGVALEYLRSGR